MRENKRLSIIKETIRKHINNNSKQYILVTLLFIIGIFIGVMFVNNFQINERDEITTYLNNFIEKLKNIDKLDNGQLLQTSIKQNVILAVTIWFFGTTVIGIPIVFGVVLYRGFCLGYTIATCVSVMGFSKGILFIIVTLVLQNFIFIPAVLALAVSGFNLYKSIVKNREKENIKLEMIRHTLFSLVMLGVLIIASLVEVFISTGIFKNLVKYW